MTSFFKHLLNAFFIGVMVFIVLAGLEVLNGGSLEFNKSLLMSFGYNQLYSITLYMVNAYTVRFLMKTFKKRLYSIKSLLLGLILSLASSAMGVFIVRIITEVGIKQQEFITFLKNENPLTYWLSMTIAVTITVIFFIVYYKQQKQSVEVKEQKIIAGSASAKFDALKNQLDPHFLFNSLNVLSSLIDENPKNAQGFTTALSKVYRYVLDQKNKELVSVDDELEFARTYSKLLEMRFEDSVVFDIPEQANNPEAKVVPLSLQLLLENAVKHNVVSVKNPLRISIFEEAGSLVVKNNLKVKEVIKKREGVGLANIKSRYSLLTDRTVEIFKTPETFEARLPMLTKKVAVAERTDPKNNTLSPKEYYEAKKKIKDIKEFYGNLTSYCIVVPFLAFINYITIGWTFMWFLFPLFGWGMGVVFHAMSVFDWNPFMGSNWEARKIKELMNEKQKERE